MVRWRDEAIAVVVVSCVAASASHGIAQERGGTVSGTVVSTVASSTAQPLAGVVIRLPHFGVMTETDEDGRFDLGLLPPGQYDISAEILGCQLAIRTVAVVGGRGSTVEVVVDRPVVAIPGLVATGRTRDLEPPYDVGHVDPQALARSPGRTIADLIRGAFPGAKVVQGSGLAGSMVSIQLRGRRSISTPQEPLIVIDGFLTGGGSIDIDPRDVEGIAVLKGSAATAHYGARGQAGVIEIRTKAGGTGGHHGPWVLVDGFLSTVGLAEIDPATVQRMELIGPDVARSLLGAGAPDAGLVQVTTNAAAVDQPPVSCFDSPSRPPGGGG